MERYLRIQRQFEMSESCLEYDTLITQARSALRMSTKEHKKYGQGCDCPETHKLRINCDQLMSLVLDTSAA